MVRPRPIAERFAEKWTLDEESGCHIWTGCKEPRFGYGSIAIGGNRAVGAHRVAYELAYGPIPVGLTIDHLCRRPSCVNPEHLEAVSLRENVLRGKAGEQTKRTHCPHGHPYDGHNLYVLRGKRYCNVCKHANRKSYVRRQRKDAWTVDDDAQLRVLYELHAGHVSFLQTVAGVIGRTRGAVATRAHRLGITR